MPECPFDLPLRADDNYVALIREPGGECALAVNASAYRRSVIAEQGRYAAQAINRHAGLVAGLSEALKLLEGLDINGATLRRLRAPLEGLEVEVEVGQ